MLGHGDFVAAIEASPGRELTIEVRRDGQPIEIRVVPRDQEGKGKIGVGLAYEQRFPPLRAIAESVRFNYDVVRQTLSVIGKIFSARRRREETPSRARSASRRSPAPRRSAASRTCSS